MCCRYFIDDLLWDFLPDLFGASDGLKRPMAERDVYPNQAAPVVYRAPDGLLLGEMVWGLPRPQNKGLYINARSETVLDKPTFRNGAEQHRCIIPARMFYEWTPRKDKVSFLHPKGDCLFLAGIFLPGGGQLRFLILTTEANDSVRPVHPRMPLILDPEQSRQWVASPACPESLLHVVPQPLDRRQEFEQLSFL